MTAALRTSRTAPGRSTLGVVPCPEVVPTRAAPGRPRRQGSVVRPTPTHPPQQRMASAGRLTVRRGAPRRGRPAALLVAALVTLALVGGLSVLGQLASPAGVVPDGTAVVRVGAGETVWDVAERVAPEADSRAVVERIRVLNGLSGGGVLPGQQLTVPDGR